MLYLLFVKISQIFQENIPIDDAVRR